MMTILSQDLKLPPTLKKTKLCENHYYKPESKSKYIFPVPTHLKVQKKLSKQSMDVFSVIIPLIAGSGSVGLLQVIKNYNKSIPEGRKTVSLKFNSSHVCVKLLL